MSLHKPEDLKSEGSESVTTCCKTDTDGEMQQHRHPCCHAHARKSPHDHDHGHQPENTARTAHETVAPDTHRCGNAHTADTVRSGDATAFIIPAMDCATEENLIRKALAHIKGIERMTFSLGTRTLFLHAGQHAIEQARKAIESIGFQVTVQDSVVARQNAGKRTRWMSIRFGAALGLAIIAEIIAMVTSHGATTSHEVWNMVGMALAGMAILLAGFSTYIKGLQALRQKRLDISALMTVAVTGAFLIGQWPEAAMVMTLYAIAELIEARAVDRARNAVQQLLDLAPDAAEVQQQDGSWKSVAVENIAVGEKIRVRPGARIALDGNIEHGQTTVDQSSVTGESLPVEKQVGDSVFAGTINQNGLIVVRTTAPAADSTLARIVREVETAQSRRAPTQQFVDRFAAVYTPSVFALALATVAWQALVSGVAWLDAIYTGLVLLVIACPCALVIATPVTIVSGLTAAARRGILIKGGVFLENAHRLQALALDKTGTITEGKPSLTAVEILHDNLSRAEILQWAHALSSASDHPVSQAISAGIEEEVLSTISSSSSADTPTHASDFKALAGRGVSAAVNGMPLYLGNHRLMEELGVCSPAIEARLHEHERQGRTLTLLANPDSVLAIFAVADAIKPTSREAIKAMHAQGIRVIMLTGDNQTTANAIATQAGLDTAVGELLPQDKLVHVQKLQRQYGVTGMTGDGINDAPALAQADIGFAMGKAGTDIAVETADIVLMSDDLRRIPETVALSRRTRRILLQNIGLALGIKAVFMVLALTGNATMWMAVFADMGASLLVVFNGLRLLRGV